MESLVNFFAEFFSVFVKEFGSLFEGHAYRAISAVIYVVAGCLVGKQIDVEVSLYGSFQQVYDVSVICDGNGFLGSEFLVSESEYLIKVIFDNVYPALVMSGLDSGKVNFSKDTNCICNVCSLGLSAGHSAESGGYEGVSCKVSVLRNAEFFTSCVKNCIECAVYDSLRSDVHPAACGHLSVVSYAHLFSDFPIVKVIIHTDHHSVGDDYTRSVGL